MAIPAIRVSRPARSYIPGMSILFDPPIRTIADLLHRLGDIPPERIRYDPVPGTATIDDLLKPENEGCELVEGTLVEKAASWQASFLGSWLLTMINNFVLARNLGAVTGEQGFLHLPDGPVRGPDVAFTSWGRMANRRWPDEPIPQMAPDLVVEVLNPNNTRAEMARKRGEYFRSGVQLVWEIDPRTRTVRVFRDRRRRLDRHRHPLWRPGPPRLHASAHASLRRARSPRIIGR
jgi:Uma2 family endonuclease